jgi:propanol-preferring alcohol dehydrogenase
MIGNGRDGGFAEQIVIPARNAIIVPPAVPIEQAAVMMCSSATALHAIRKGRLQPGETVAVFGAGGLGVSAIQLARVLGAREVYAVDMNPAKLAGASNLGAIAVDARQDPVADLLATGGVDVALDLVGSALVMENCLRSLAPMGRAVAVGLTSETMPVGPYTDLVNGESELIGASDHTAAEIEELLGLAKDGQLDLTDVVQRSVPLEADPVNRAMDELAQWSDVIRTVIVPGT